MFLRDRKVSCVEFELFSQLLAEFFMITHSILNLAYCVEFELLADYRLQIHSLIPHRKQVHVYRVLKKKKISCVLVLSMNEFWLEQRKLCGIPIIPASPASSCTASRTMFISFILAVVHMYVMQLQSRISPEWIVLNCTRSPCLGKYFGAILKCT